MKYQIPFNKPSFTGKEQQYIAEAINNGHISGDGPFTQKCENLLAEQLGTIKVLLTTSCTHSLEMAALLLDIKPGDEIILPAYTFVSTASAFALRGAKLVFSDICRNTLNIDEKIIEQKISPQTKVIVPVHYGGVGCNMASIMALAKKHGIAIVEDNAHGLFGKCDGQYLGTFGCLATQSFHETKNFTCGEGGALVINDPTLVERAEIIREKGTNRKSFSRGQIDKYSWVDLGSSYVPSEILAAFLLSQLEARNNIQEKRKEIWERYYSGLREWAIDNNTILPHVPSNCEQSYHLFYLILPNKKVRQKLIDHLAKQSILSVFHYLPLHLSRMGMRYGGKQGDNPVSEDISDRLLRLPFYNTLSVDEQEKVVRQILRFKAT